MAHELFLIMLFAVILISALVIAVFATHKVDGKAAVAILVWYALLVAVLIVLSFKGGNVDEFAEMIRKLICGAASLTVGTIGYIFLFKN